MMPTVCTPNKCLKINEAKTGGLKKETEKVAIIVGEHSPKYYILTHEKNIGKFGMTEIISI